MQEQWVIWQPVWDGPRLSYGQEWQSFETKTLVSLDQESTLQTADQLSLQRNRHNLLYVGVLYTEPIFKLHHANPKHFYSFKCSWIKGGLAYLCSRPLKHSTMLLSKKQLATMRCSGRIAPARVKSRCRGVISCSLNQGSQPGAPAHSRAIFGFNLPSGTTCLVTGAFTPNHAGCWAIVGVRGKQVALTGTLPDFIAVATTETLPYALINLLLAVFRTATPSIAWHAGQFGGDVGSRVTCT